MRCSALILHYGSEEELYSSGREASRNSHQERDSDNSEISCNLHVEGSSFTVLQAPVLKMKYLQVSEKRFRNQFWGKFCCCLFKLDTSVMCAVRKCLKMMQWLFFTHELISFTQEDGQLALFSWFFFKASVGATAVRLCPEWCHATEVIWSLTT